MGNIVLDQESRRISAAAFDGVISDLEREITQLITTIKKITFTKDLKLRGQLSLECQRIERLLELLDRFSSTGTKSNDGVPCFEVSHLCLDAHGLLAKARSLCAASLCKGKVEGNVVHLVADSIKTEREEFSLMLASLDIDTLFAEAEFAEAEADPEFAEREESQRKKPALRLVVNTKI